MKKSNSRKTCKFKMKNRSTNSLEKKIPKS